RYDKRARGARTHRLRTSGRIERGIRTRDELTTSRPARLRAPLLRRRERLANPVETPSLRAKLSIIRNASLFGQPTNSGRSTAFARHEVKRGGGLAAAQSRWERASPDYSGDSRDQPQAVGGGLAQCDVAIERPGARLQRASVASSSVRSRRRQNVPS